MDDYYQWKLQDVAAPVDDTLRSLILDESNLLAAWGCESATSDSDLSGNGNTVTWYNTPSVGGGVYGDALTFVPASSEYGRATAAAGLTFGTGDFSIEFVLTLTAWPAASQFVIGHLGAGGDNEYEVYLSGGDNNLIRSRIAPTAGGGYVSTATGTSLYDGAPHHYVLVADRSGNAQWYVDGSASGAALDISGASGQAVGSASHALYIAARYESATVKSYLAGTLDEIAVYSKVLSEVSIAAHAAAAGV